MSNTPAAPAPEAAAPTRQCGRCRGVFDGEPGVAAAPSVEWWLCDSCQRILLPTAAKRDQGVALAAEPQRPASERGSS